ncbi:MAG TPA: hypothetical protein VMX97_17675, partial [Hyphomicrobiaceae bacterium]|nr:hypothetical protein [Hyphomicrobiaceae bacterium]
MTENGNKQVEHARLSVVLDAYGAATERWPERDRVALTALVSSDAVARRMVAEARALDNLISADRRAVPPEVPFALMGRIMDQATVDGGGDKAAPGKIIDLRERGAELTRFQKVRPDRTGRRLWQHFPAAAVLAASLVFGVYAGGAGYLQSTLDGMRDVVGLSVGVDADQISLLSGVARED